MSHTLPRPEGSQEGATLRAKVHLIMERITGYAPPTCPWRAMYSPLVREVMAAVRHEEKGNLAVALGPDPVGVLVDGVGVFTAALAAVRLEDSKLAAMKAKQARGPAKR